MFIYTLTKKKAVRAGIIAVAVFTGVAIGTAAVFTALRSSAAERKVPIYSVSLPEGERKIAITFDAAWGNSNTTELIDILAKENVKATFFVTGDFASKYPEDVRKLAQAGHSIENHSNIHPHVNDMNINDLIADTKEAERKIVAAAGEKPTYYRTPYGEYNDTVLTTIEGMGYQVIQWSADSVDWKENNPDKIKKRILDTTENGGILLFHNDLPATTEALPGIISELKAKGFEFAPLEEIIYKDDYTLDATGKQIKQQRAWFSGNELQEVIDVMANGQTTSENSLETASTDTSSVTDMSQITTGNILENAGGTAGAELQNTNTAPATTSTRTEEDFKG